MWGGAFTSHPLPAAQVELWDVQVYLVQYLHMAYLPFLDLHRWSRLRKCPLLLPLGVE